MKKQIGWTIPLMLATVLAWCPAHADVISVISQEYSIEGAASFSNIYSFLEWGAPRSESYQKTAGTPVSGAIDWRSPTVPYTGFAYVETLAEGGVTESGAWIHAFVTAQDSDSAETTAYGFASAVLTFSPLVPLLVATINERITVPYEGAPHSVQLLDLTTNVSLLPPSVDYSFWYAREPLALSLDFSHVYEMRTTFSIGGSWDPREYSLGLRGQEVPEPGTLLLLGTGLAGLGGMAWRHRG